MAPQRFGDCPDNAMKTRFLFPNETEKVIDWLMAWRGHPMEARDAERLFVPRDWTIGVFSEDGRILAGGAIYPTIQGDLGFMGKVISDPEGDRLENAAALRVLVREMKRELAKTGAKIAMSLYGEEPMARIAANGIPATPVFLVLSPTEE